MTAVTGGNLLSWVMPCRHKASYEQTCMSMSAEGRTLKKYVRWIAQHCGHNWKWFLVSSRLARKSTVDRPDILTTDCERRTFDFRCSSTCLIHVHTKECHWMISFQIFNTIAMITPSNIPHLLYLGYNNNCKTIFAEKMRNRTSPTNISYP